MLDTPDRCPADITRRETQVLHLLMQGLSNKMISREIGGSERTMETHVRSL
jgi:DNA-binding NarL/FixJ family response regulator